MKRTYEKDNRPVTSAKPTTLNLQTRPFASIQADSDQDDKATDGVSNQSRVPSSQNILARLIANPTPETVATPIRRKVFPSMRIPIQAKLNIGEPNDKYEKEADNTAAKVVQQINSSSQDNSVQKQETEEDALQRSPVIPKLQLKALVQRRENLGGGEASEDLESSIQSARGNGQALDANLRTKMGQAMGADFSSVKVHTDSQSDQLNQSIQAKAFTTGQDLFFSQGSYDPSSRGGQELIAHELTHVVQQNGNNVQRKFDVSRIQRVSVKERIAFFESLGVEEESGIGRMNVSPEKAEQALTKKEESRNKYSAYSADTFSEKPDTFSEKPDTFSGKSDTFSSISFSISFSEEEEEEDKYDNYEAPKKYGKVNKRADHYEGEDKDSRDVTHVNEIFGALENSVATAKLASVAEGLKKGFGWSDEDIAKYYDNKEKSQVEYLDEESRKDYELVGGSTLTQGDPPLPFDTSKMFSKHSGNGFGIYVMSPNGELYSHAHKVGLFHHSSFLAGLPTAGAGEIKVDGGTVKHVTNKSGHYQPDDENMKQTLEELRSRGVNLAGVKLTMVDGREFASALDLLA